jgi:SAM-dependent methyltransferase
VGAFFDAFAASDPRWRRRNAGYHRLIAKVMRFHVPPGRRVLEIGSGGGWLLSELKPSNGLGIDVSKAMVAEATERFRGLRFERMAGEELELDERFDYIVLSDLLPYADDILDLLERVAAISLPDTRIVINSYSNVWKPILSVAEHLGLKPRKPIRNWVSPHDVTNLLELAGLEVVSLHRRILWPKRVPLLAPFLNAVIANIWPFNHLCLTYWIVARPMPATRPETSVSVVCPCRNEAGHIESLIDRLPVMGTATELIFVEGGSTDDTRKVIEQNLRRRTDISISMLTQTGRGKGDAVRAGFAAAQNDVLMILDGDLTVPPEYLPRFYRALIDQRGELINGSRLVYSPEPGAMRFLNVLGNKLFSATLRAITGQQVKDTLCGTKVLRRDSYVEIARNRSYFGEFDPFGDFDLLFGASRLGHKVVDLPVHYETRVYGATNINRWRHGVLLARMSLFAFWKFRVAPVL